MEKKVLENGRDCFLVDGGNMERKGRLKNGLGCL